MALAILITFFLSFEYISFFSCTLIPWFLLQLLSIWLIAFCSVLFTCLWIFMFYFDCALWMSSFYSLSRLLSSFTRYAHALFASSSISCLCFTWLYLSILIVLTLSFASCFYASCFYYILIFFRNCCSFWIFLSSNFCASRSVSLIFLIVFSSDILSSATRFANFLASSSILPLSFLTSVSSPLSYAACSCYADHSLISISSDLLFLSATSFLPVTLLRTLPPISQFTKLLQLPSVFPRLAFWMLHSSCWVTHDCSLMW